MHEPRDLPELLPGPGAKRRWMLALGLAGVMILLWFTRYGLGGTSDSVDYVASARGLLSGHGYQNQRLGLYVLWTPLYPAVLAFLRLLGRDFFGAPRYFQALGYGLTVAVITGVLWKDLRHRWVAVGGGLLMLASPPLLAVSGMLWSEPLYILLLVLVVALYPRALARDRLVDLAWIAVPAGLAAAQRYSGVTIIAAACLQLLLASDGAWRRRLKRAVVFGAASSLPLVAWMVRNLILCGSVAGHRRASRNALGPNLWSGLHQIGDWWVPRPLGTIAAVTVAVVVLVIAVLALVPGAERRRALPHLSPRLRFAGLIGLIYLAFMLVAVLATGLERLSMRYLSPAAPALILVLAGGLDDLASRPRARGARIAVSAVAAALLLLFTVTSARQLVLQVRRVNRQRAMTSLTGPQWTDSAVVHWVRSRRPGRSRIFTNAFLPLRLYADPPKLLSRTLAEVGDQLDRRVPGDYVLMFLGRAGWQQEAVEAIARRHPDEVIFRGADGLVLRPPPREPAP